MIPKSIIVHHSASSRDNTTIQNLEDWHKLRWSDFISSLGWHIGYHWIILADGTIKQTRRNNEIGAHCIPNDGKIGICLTGNFEIEIPSEAQLTSLQTLLEKLKKDYQFTDDVIFAHREKSQTLCPGKNLYEWLTKYRKLGWLKMQILKLQEILKGLLNNNK